MDSNSNLLRALIVAMALLTVAAPMVSMGVLAAETGNADDIDPSAEPAQNPYIDTDVTKDKHNMSAFGADQASLLSYYDNDGDAAALPASLNESVDNPVSYTPTHVAVDEYGAFPHDDNASALNASLWSTDASGSSGTVAANDVTVQPNVEAVELSATGQASGDTATLTYDDVSITSDEAKRNLIIGGDIQTLSSDATVEVRVVDEDGDYKAITADTGANSSDDDVWATSTGDSRIEQQRLGEIATQGSGDGDFNNIESVEVVVMDGDFEGQISLMNLDQMSRYDFGEKMVDTDGDGEMDDTETLHEPTGEVSVTGLDTLGDTFDSATLHGVTFPAMFQASELSGDDVYANFTSAEDYQNYEYIGDTRYRFEMVDAYELSYANAELRDTVTLPETRYRTVQYAEGTGDTDLKNVSEWTDVTDSYSTQGDEVTLDATLQPGQNIDYNANALYTSDEQQSIFSAGDSGGGGGMFGGGGGGILGAIFSPISGAIAAILSFLGIKAKAG